MTSDDIQYQMSLMLVIFKQAIQQTLRSPSVNLAQLSLDLQATSTRVNDKIDQINDKELDISKEEVEDMEKEFVTAYERYMKTQRDMVNLNGLMGKIVDKKLGEKMVRKH